MIPSEHQPQTKAIGAEPNEAARGAGGAAAIARAEPASRARQLEAWIAESRARVEAWLAEFDRIRLTPRSDDDRASKPVPLGPDTALGLLLGNGAHCVIRLSTPTETAFLEFHERKLTSASSSASPRGERLGEILVELGFVEQCDLDEVLAAESRSNERIGERLVERGKLTPDELELGLHRQFLGLLQRVASAPTLQITLSR